MHNMAASSAFPVDSLRSASFTQQHGTTPSIIGLRAFQLRGPAGRQGRETHPAGPRTL
ncbi:MAG: zinc-dependent metalloprotease [Alistipes shahii]